MVITISVQKEGALHRLQCTGNIISLLIVQIQIVTDVNPGSVAIQRFKTKITLTTK